MTKPTVGLVLGGGGAVGVMHIPVLEALDELGIKPAVIAGTSIGALVGVMYAAGMPGQEIRAHFMKLGARPLKELGHVVWRRGLGFNRGLLALNSERFTKLILPEGLPARFEDLEIPFRSIAMDFHAKKAVPLSSGELIPAVAASIAVPGVFKPVMLQGRPLVDGGIIENLPLTHAAGAEKVVAVNVFTDPESQSTARPGNLKAVGAALRTMLCKQVDAALAAHPPFALIEAPYQKVGLGSLWRIEKMLAAAEPMRTETLRRLAELE